MSTYQDVRVNILPLKLRLMCVYIHAVVAVKRKKFPNQLLQSVLKNLPARDSLPSEAVVP